MLPPAAAAIAPESVLLRELLAVSFTGIILYTPVYDSSGSGTVVDFAFEYLNPAAQRLLGLPEVPPLTHQQQWSHGTAKGIFQFHADAFVTGEPRAYRANYQANGHDKYYHLAARRVGTGLLVSLTDTDTGTADQPRRPVEEASPDSKAREQAVRAEAAAARATSLSAQQNQLRLILGEVPTAIALLTGPAHHHAFFNQVWQTISRGRARLGLSVAAAYPEVVEQGFIDLLDEVYATGKPFRAAEWPTQMLDPATGQSRLHYLDFLYQALPDARGQTQSILVFAVDVTDKVLARQQAEALQADLLAAARQQVQEREAFRNVFEQTPALIALLRAPGHRFEYVNPAYQTLFPGRQLVGLDLGEAIPEMQAQGFVALLDRVYQTGETYFGAEQPFVAALVAGQLPRTQYFNFTYQAYREAGEIAGVSIFAFDVTEQVRARQQRDTERQQLRDLFEQAPVAISILRGANYVVEVANPLMARLWGRTPAELLGRPVFEALPEAREQGFKELLDEVWRSGEAFVAESVPAQLRRDDTVQTVYLNYVYQPLRAADGTITGVAAVGTDVTAQVWDRQRVQELNDQLAAINGQLEASNAGLAASNQQLIRTNVDLDNFIYTASHDLGAPISNIEGLLYLLHEDLPAAVAQAPEIGPTLARMLDSVERFKRTIDHLTEVSKLQKEHTPASESVSLAAVVEDVRQDLWPLLRETGTRLLISVAATPPVHFAAKNLRSVVFNLLSNAVKYRSPARTPHVDVRTHVRAGHTVLEVHDNGLGLAPAQLARLFGMFERFHDHVDGTGIGLYMVKRMVENAGGRIEVHSQLGAGTTFFVHLPHAAAPLPTP